MGFFKSLVKVAVNTVTLPVSAAKDFVTGDFIEVKNATTRNMDRWNRTMDELLDDVDTDS